LISDILHNTGSSIQTKSYFWSYRMYFEYKLPEIFESINKALLHNNSFDKWEKNEFKDNVMRVLRIWNDWGLYDSKYIFGLEALLNRKEKHFYSSFSVAYSDKDETQKFIVQDTSTQIGIKLRVMEEGLIKETHTMLEKACRANGLPITGTRQNIIERLLILEEYRLLQDGDNLGDSTTKTLENQKIIALALIEKFNKPSKFLSRESVPELEQSVQDSLELLKILQKRYEKLNESDIDGLPLDEIDMKFYDVPREEEVVIPVLTTVPVVNTTVNPTGRGWSEQQQDPSVIQPTRVKKSKFDMESNEALNIKYSSKKLNFCIFSKLIRN
jgi:hypothetical protein